MSIRATALAQVTPIFNPIDRVEEVIFARDWPHDRPSDNEVLAEVPTSWCDVRMWFLWADDADMLQVSCTFDARVPEKVRSQVYPLLAMVNERLALGRFVLSCEDGTVGFCYSFLLRGTHGPSEEQLEDFLALAVRECERFYPAFQSLVWGGKSAEEALQIAVFETAGTA